MGISLLRNGHNEFNLIFWGEIMDKIFTYAALSFIKSFNDTLKQEKKYITKMLIITRLDKNLNVLRAIF